MARRIHRLYSSGDEFNYLDFRICFRIYVKRNTQTIFSVWIICLISLVVNSICLYSLPKQFRHATNLSHNCKSWDKIKHIVIDGDPELLFFLEITIIQNKNQPTNRKKFISLHWKSLVETLEFTWKMEKPYHAYLIDLCQTQYLLSQFWLWPEELSILNTQCSDVKHILRLYTKIHNREEVAFQMSGTKLCIRIWT